MPKKKQKEYSFTATQLLRSHGMVYITASNLKEAKERLKKVKRDTIDWYDDNLDEQIEHNQVTFTLEGIESVE